MAKYLKKWHPYLLGIQTVALCALSLKLWLAPSTPNQMSPIADYGKIQIENWQNIAQKSLTQNEITSLISGEFRGGTEQLLTQQDQILTLKVATFSHSNGDLKKYLKNYSDNLLTITQYDLNVGHYAVFAENDRLTMTACLTELQQGTVTADQFKVTQIRAAFNTIQLWRWLRNQDQLIPHTCHWRSLSLSPITPEANKRLLHIWLTLNKTMPTL
ncbi:hypothetical protein NIES208_02270 [[Limnothrix rosea] IAM M-220]|nr:hypothetical protein NIES208_02270 [[Limnothrix rosea] IAM M-220]